MLKVNPKFKSLIPPLSKEEFDGLEQDILANGVREAIVVWNGTIVDGHHRYEICYRHGLPYTTREEHFHSEAEAIAWMIKEQFNRRNMSRLARTILALNAKDALLQIGRQRQGLRKDLANYVAEYGDQNQEADNAHETDNAQETGKAVITDKAVIIDSNQQVDNTDNEQNTDIYRNAHNTRQLIAKKAGVSATFVYEVDYVLQHGAPAIVEAMVSEKMPVKTAYTKTRQSDEKLEQKKQKRERHKRDIQIATSSDMSDLNTSIAPDLNTSITPGLNTSITPGLNTSITPVIIPAQGADDEYEKNSTSDVTLNQAVCKERKTPPIEQEEWTEFPKLTPEDQERALHIASSINVTPEEMARIMRLIKEADEETKKKLRRGLISVDAAYNALVSNVTSTSTPASPAAPASTSAPPLTSPLALASSSTFTSTTADKMDSGTEGDRLDGYDNDDAPFDDSDGDGNDNDDDEDENPFDHTEDDDDDDPFDDSDEDDDDDEDENAFEDYDDDDDENAFEDDDDDGDDDSDDDDVDDDDDDAFHNRFEGLYRCEHCNRYVKPEKLVLIKLNGRRKKMSVCPECSEYLADAKNTQNRVNQIRNQLFGQLDGLLDQLDIILDRYSGIDIPASVVDQMNKVISETADEAIRTIKTRAGADRR